MNRHTLLLTLAVAGLIAFGVWIARNTYWAEEEVYRRLSGEALRNPFYAAELFAEELGASAEVRHSVSDLPPGGVLMLASWNWSLIGSRREAIEAWVENGGRLVIDRDLVATDASLDDWAGLTRLRVKAGGEPIESIDDESAHRDETGCGRVQVHHDVAGISRYRQEYEVCTLPVLKAIASRSEPEWALGDDEGFQAVRVRVGKGSVTWLNAQPFTRRDLFIADHAHLFVAATQLQRGDHIVFMWEEAQPTLLTLIWRHGWPVVVLFALWLIAVLWRNAVRFGPAAPVPVQARRSLAEQIKGTSEFTRRFGGGRALHAAEVRALNEAAAKHIPGFHSMGQDERLTALAKLTSIDAERLGETINYPGPRKSLELKRALELLEQARRRLQSQMVRAGESMHGG